MELRVGDNGNGDHPPYRRSVGICPRDEGARQDRPIWLLGVRVPFDGALCRGSIQFTAGECPAIGMDSDHRLGCFSPVGMVVRFASDGELAGALNGSKDKEGKRMRFIKASLVVLSAMSSCVVILWLVGRTDKIGSWFVVFPAFLGLASNRTCRLRGNAWSRDTSGRHFQEVVRSRELDHAAGNMCRFAGVDVALARVGPSGRLRDLSVGDLSEDAAVDRCRQPPSCRVVARGGGIQFLRTGNRSGRTEHRAIVRDTFSTRSVRL